jgi:hypothetical protein
MSLDIAEKIRGKCKEQGKSDKLAEMGEKNGRHEKIEEHQSYRKMSRI